MDAIDCGESAMISGLRGYRSAICLIVTVIRPGQSPASMKWVCRFLFKITTVTLNRVYRICNRIDFARTGQVSRLTLASGLAVAHRTRPSLDQTRFNQANS